MTNEFDPAARYAINEALFASLAPVPTHLRTVVETDESGQLVLARKECPGSNQSPRSGSIIYISHQEIMPQIHGICAFNCGALIIWNYGTRKWEVR